MLIYQGSQSDFLQDVKDDRIADIMADQFRSRFGSIPTQGEYFAWRNSLRSMAQVIESSRCKDIAVALEYEIPYNQGRIDCLLFGRDEYNLDNMLSIELKQWTYAKPVEDEGNFMVETRYKAGESITPHPSQQTKGYHKYLQSFVEELSTDAPIELFSCSFCHNYTYKPGEGLHHKMYDQINDEYPLYCKGDEEVLSKKIFDLIGYGSGEVVYNRFMQSRIRPSKRLLDYVAKLITGQFAFALINEQIIAKNTIWSRVKKSLRNGRKSVIVVKGGPGTGKSVIALQVLAEAARKNHSVFLGCKSKPFTEGLRNLVGRHANVLITNLYAYLPSRTEEDEIDLLLIDEAHRIEKSSNFRFTRKHDKTNMPQVDQLIRCAKTSVFFIDDYQNVRSQEIGRSAVIEEAAKKFDAHVSEIELLSQFRCMGSNDYLNWLESVLGYSDEEVILKKSDKFDFQIFDSPHDLYDMILAKEEEKRNSARLVAGYCWPWTPNLDHKGELVKDVVIGDFAMPWETHGNITPPPGYVKWYEWAYREEGVKQIGCIYTAQGYDFDYIGVIIADDLVYNRQSGSIDTDISATCDATLRRGAANFDEHVRNIYRTLLTRGMKGCYVFFTNPETRNFFQSRIEKYK